MSSVNATRHMSPPRFLFCGVRNVAAKHLALLPVDGISGAWGLTSTANGFITAETSILVLQDLV